MSQQDSNLKNIINEIEKYKEELSNMLELSRIQENKLDEYNTELNSLKKELNSIKEINNKTKDFLLLELESNLDQQKQIQIKQDSKADSFKEIINLLKEENSNNIDSLSSLNIEIGKLEQSIDDKDKLINTLELKNRELNECVSVKDKKLSQLGEEIILTKKDFKEEISKLNEDIVSFKKSSHENEEKLNNTISQKNNNLDQLNKELEILNDKNSFLQRSMDEKNKNIDLLKEEIAVLKSIIHEKDKTINSLDMGD